MDILLDLLQYVGPALVALLTVFVMQGLKKAVAFIDGLPALAKRILVILISFGLTELGTFLNLALPETLSLFTEADVEALLSAGLALAIHAGDKAGGDSTEAT